MRAITLALLLGAAVAHPTDYSLADQELTMPTEFSSGDTGSLSATITMDQFRYEGHANTGTFWTRAYNGALPGPTLRFRAGDTVTVQFNNALGPQPDNVVVHNEYHSPNTTNFHTHGLHVSSIAPADNVFIEVAPGNSYTYVFDIPSDHAPGVFWYHAHKHSSTALQVGGGASGLMIIEDEDGAIPAAYSSMEEVLLLLQEFPMTGGAANLDIATASGDTLTTVDNQMVTQDFVLVNGYYKPRVSMVTNKWYRFRVVYSGVFTPVDLDIETCEVQLIGKDGVYLRNAPRTLVSTMPLAPGNRVEFAVRCTDAGTHTLISGTGEGAKNQKQMGGGGGGGGGGGVHNFDLVSLVVTTNTGAADDDLPDLNFSYPDYLTDLTTLPDGITANTVSHSFNGAAGGCTLNGVAFAEDPQPNYSIAVGTVQEWTLTGIGAHPFHIHVTPFQITTIDTNDYHQVGDWYDVLYTGTFTLANSPVVRFQTDRFTGEYVIHCHLLSHEDQGCMGYAEVTGVEGTPAIVTRLDTTPSATPSPSAAPSGTPSPSAAPSGTPSPSPSSPAALDECTGPSIPLAFLSQVLSDFSGIDGVCSS